MATDTRGAWEAFSSAADAYVALRRQLELRASEKAFVAAMLREQALFLRARGVSVEAPEAGRAAQRRFMGRRPGFLGRR